MFSGSGIPGAGFGTCGPALAEFELLFHVAHGGEVFVELLLVALAEMALERLRVALHGVEDRALEREAVRGALAIGRVVGDEELAEQLRGPGIGGTRVPLRVQDIRQPPWMPSSEPIVERGKARGAADASPPRAGRG